MTRTTTLLRRLVPSLAVAALIVAVAAASAWAVDPPRPSYSPDCNRFALKYDPETRAWYCVDKNGSIEKSKRAKKEASRSEKKRTTKPVDDDVLQETRQRTDALQRDAQQRAQEIFQRHEELQREALERAEELIRENQARVQKLRQQQQQLVQQQQQRQLQLLQQQQQLSKQ